MSTPSGLDAGTPRVPVRIAGVGWYAPPRVETATAVADILGVSEAWLLRHAGARERRVADEPVEALAAHAVRAAVGDQPPPDALVFAAATTRQLIPDTSAFVAGELGWSGLATWTVNAACLSFLPALAQAGALIQAGVMRRVVVVSAERGTLGRSPLAPEAAALLGDGAAAVLLEAPAAGDPAGLMSLTLRTLPEGAELAQVPGYGAHRPHNDAADRAFSMHGPRIYRLVRAALPEVVDASLAAAGVGIDDIDLVVPHQASGRALDLLIPALRLREDRVVRIHDGFGNCVAASLPMALAMAAERGQLRRGDHVLLVGTGAGVSLGAAVLRW